MIASDAIQSELTAMKNKQNVPPDVHALTSSLTFWERAVPGWVISVVAIAILSALAVAQDSPMLIVPFALTTLLFVAWWTYRAFWTWDGRPIKATTATGMLEWGQAGPLWLLLTDSPPDEVQLDKFDTDTPPRNILQRLFGCADIKLSDGRVISNVCLGDIKAIKEVRDYFKNSDLRDLAQGELALRISIAQLRQLEDNNKVLNEVRDALHALTSGLGNLMSSEEATQIKSALTALQQQPPTS